MEIWHKKIRIKKMINQMWWKVFGNCSENDWFDEPHEQCEAKGNATITWTKCKDQVSHLQKPGSGN